MKLFYKRTSAKTHAYYQTTLRKAMSNHKSLISTIPLFFK